MSDDLQPRRRRRRRANRSRESYVSTDPAKRAAQLANLRPAPPAPNGHTRSLRHGAQSALLVRDVEAEVLELMEALGDTAPVRDVDGSLPASDVVAVERAARALKRYRHVTKWCDLHGRLDEKTGDVKPAAEHELKCERELAAALEVLGCTPMARSKLGLNLARTQSVGLAQVMDGGVVDAEAHR